METWSYRARVGSKPERLEPARLFQICCFNTDEREARPWRRR